MDGGVDEEVGHLDATQGVRLQGKDSEYSRKSESGTQLEPQEGVIPTEVEYHESSSHHVLGDILEGKDVNLSLSSIDGLDRPYASPHTIDASGMVEELTVRHYTNLNMAVVGPSNRSYGMHPWLNQWQQLHHTAGRYAFGSTHGCPTYQEKSLGRNSLLEDMACKPVSEILPQKPFIVEQNEAALASSENKGTIDNALACGAFKTKILSKSGFSEYFIKSALKGKGIICRGPPVENQHVESRNQNNVKIGTGLKSAPEAPPNSAGNTLIPAVHEITGTRAILPDNDGVSLRRWLDNGNRELNKVERLNMFRQIVDLVDYYHSSGVALHELRPSSFEFLPSNQVKYLGSLEQREFLESVKGGNFSNSSALVVAKRPSEHGMLHPLSSSSKKQKFNEHINYRQWPQFPLRPRLNAGVASVGDINASGLRFCEYSELNKEYDSQRSNNRCKPIALEQHPHVVSSQLEEKWYQSPEEVTGSSASSISSSNIYCLGVLLFEVWFIMSSSHLQQWLKVQSMLAVL